MGFRVYRVNSLGGFAGLTGFVAYKRVASNKGFSFRRAVSKRLRIKLWASRAHLAGITPIHTGLAGNLRIFSGRRAFCQENPETLNPKPE